MLKMSRAGLNKKKHFGGIAEMNVLESICKNELCTGCGACVGVCPNNALQMFNQPKKGIYLPTLKNSENCTRCGLCVKVCPVLTADISKLNQLVFGKSPDDFLLGRVLNFYVGHSTCDKLRWDAASGGLASSLLIFALEEGMIDGAIVTRMRKENPLEPEVIIARTAEEVLLASKSKYCPVPVNVKTRDIIDQEGKFAIVGLPCHIQGFRKAEMLNKRLREKMLMHIGLLCSHTVNLIGTVFLLKKFGIRVEDVIGIDYRGRGWPGMMVIKLSNGKEKCLPYPWYWLCFFEAFFFTPTCCFACSDATNELADISLGDAWLSKLISKGNIGESLVMTRTQVGEELLKKAAKQRRVSVHKVSRKEVVQSQMGLLLKKRNLRARLFALRLFGRRMPETGCIPFNAKPLAYFSSAVAFLNSQLTQSTVFRKILEMTPLKGVSMYSSFLHQMKRYI